LKELNSQTEQAVIQMLQQNKPRWQVEEFLVAQGYSQQNAYQIVGNYMKSLGRGYKSDRVFWVVLWILGGVFLIGLAGGVTFLSYSMAMTGATGGFFLVAGGLASGGLTMIWRGIKLLINRAD
jgi:hypothetical protein